MDRRKGKEERWRRGDKDRMRGRVGEEGMRRGRREEMGGERRRGGELEWKRGVDWIGGEEETRS